MSTSSYRIASRELPGASVAHRLGLVDQVAEHVARLDRARLQVLDAGAGRWLRLKFPEDARFTGIDISEEALGLHTALSERIVGDLQSYPLAREAYDVIVCWDVLEHLEDPVSALANMNSALARGGLLVIGSPNLWSPKALVAKFTPHWFHVFVYRRIWHVPHAGEPTYPPFPTHLRLSVAPRRLCGIARASGLEVAMLAFYDTLEPRTPALRKLWSAFRYLARLSGEAHFGDSDFCAVFRKPGGSSPQAA